MQVKFFEPGAEFKSHEAEYTKAWLRVRRAGDLILREDVAKFERKLARYCGKKYAVALNSGTDALYLSLWALGIGKGDEVILPSHTFVATAQVVAQLGAKPVLVDMGDEWRSKITPKTKAIMPVHIAGDVLNWRSSQYSVIEDACQSIGSEGVGFGDVQCWSFYPAKVLGGPGDGGAITTNRKDLYDAIQELRNHWKSDYSKWGINSRLDNVVAAELNIKIDRLPNTIRRRRQVALHYISSLKNVAGLTLPVDFPGRTWQDFIIRTDRRDELYEYLFKKGIETMKNEYPMPIGKLPKAKLYEAQTLRLPINEVLQRRSIDHVNKMIKKFYAESV